MSRANLALSIISQKHFSSKSIPKKTLFENLNFFKNKLYILEANKPNNNFNKSSNTKSYFSKSIKCLKHNCFQNFFHGPVDREARKNINKNT
jgi:hypothetical protein